MDNLLILIIGMGLVTFIPRLIPMMWFNDLKLNRFWELFFDYLPYAMLSALIFPSILSASGSAFLSLIGFAAALLLSFLNLNSMYVVIGSVFVVYLATFI